MGAMHDLLIFRPHFCPFRCPLTTRVPSGLGSGRLCAWELRPIYQLFDHIFVHFGVKYLVPRLQAAARPLQLVY